MIRKCERVTRISGPGPQLGAIPRDNNKAFLRFKKRNYRRLRAQCFLLFNILFEVYLI